MRKQIFRFWRLTSKNEVITFLLKAKSLKKIFFTPMLGKSGFLQFLTISSTLKLGINFGNHDRHVIQCRITVETKQNIGPGV